MILLGLPEPDEGWLLEEVEAALHQAEYCGRVMPRDKFITKAGRRAEDAMLGSII